MARRNPSGKDKLKTVALIGAAGGAAYYFFVHRPRQQAAMYAAMQAGRPAEKVGPWGAIRDLGVGVLSIFGKKEEAAAPTTAVARAAVSPITGARYGKVGTRCFDYSARKYVADSYCASPTLGPFKALSGYNGSLQSSGKHGSLSDGGHTLSSQGYGSLS